MAVVLEKLTYQDRLDALHATKLKHTREKQQVIGSMDYDDWGLILPPPEARETIQTISPSGEPITDVLVKGFKARSNHPSGGFFGPKAAGENFRVLLESHPAYVDPMSSLAGACMVNFSSYRNVRWNPDFDYSHLHEEQKKYQLATGIGGLQHFCQDLTIGLELGWGGLLEKIQRYRKINRHAADFYAGLEDTILGIQNWIRRHAEAARRMAQTEVNPQLRENLETTADINEQLVTDPPHTFREACQWILWYQVVARMYNGSGSLGRLDVLLLPYYEQDTAAGILTDDEAAFHIACMLLRDTSYIQLGGPDATGKDVTNPASFLVLEALHRLKIPANIGVCVGEGVDPNLLRRGIAYLFEDKMGMPKLLGINNTVEGFTKNGYPIELARQRAYSGCHWFGIPGREYTLMDCVKVNFAAIFDVALREMMSDSTVTPSVEELWRWFVKHLRRAIEVLAEGLDFHLEHMHQVLPELVLDLLSYGPIEKGLDASHGGVEYYNMCIDGTDLATVADSFAAVEQRVEKENRLTWQELLRHLDNDYAGAEDVRLMLRNIQRFGSGRSRADEWAVRISQTFSELVKEKPTPAGHNMIPGLFAWASNIRMGQGVGATPNGRHAGAAISHGPNPEPGFNEGNGGTPTQMVLAVAAVQSGYGNTAPLQLDVDPGLRDEETREKMMALINTHFALGGTMINMNVVNKEQILEAHKDPAKFPDLVVRVTGFSAYWASLSEEFRQLVVDRITSEG